jgi:Rps23 Pro-64 3,4-dihydroxylase Tpa1-like proline 4-hydroxylase
MDAAITFGFETASLSPLVPALLEEFRTARPFRHVVFDGLVPDAVLDAVVAEAPGPGVANWQEDAGLQKRKATVESEREMGPATRNLIRELNSQAFLGLLRDVTGIDALIPDPELFGGGLHQIGRGGMLKVHADFNVHPTTKLDRRLNLLLYLNRAWSEDYGGHLELWDRDMTSCAKRVLPTWGRCVIFATTDFSYHGHPEPLSCPEDTLRRSIAMYYYTNGRPPEERTRSHSTLFQSRPGEELPELGGRRRGGPASRWAKALLPPIVTDAVRGRKRNRE